MWGELRRGDRARARHVAADHAACRHSALVAVKVQSRLSQSSGPAEAAPVIVSVAPVSAPVAAKLPPSLRPRPSACPWTHRPPW